MSRPEPAHMDGASKRLDYWNRGVENVPHMTGAARLMDGRDFVEVCKHLGVDIPLRNVLDVGCGTGRLADYCEGWLGVDISADAVAYCRKHGRDARLIRGPSDLPLNMAPTPFAAVVCASVFTHIDADERTEYLLAFRRRAPLALVDIIQGDGSGGVEKWTADPFSFGRQVDTAGFDVKGVWRRRSPQGVEHTHFRLEVR